MKVDKSCKYYDGDDDCAKCAKHGILIGGCAGCEEYKEDDYWDEATKERMSIWAN